MTVGTNKYIGADANTAKNCMNWSTCCASTAMLFTISPSVRSLRPALERSAGFSKIKPLRANQHCRALRLHMCQLPCCRIEAAAVLNVSKAHMRRPTPTEAWPWMALINSPTNRGPLMSSNAWQLIMAKQSRSVLPINFAQATARLAFAPLVFTSCSQSFLRCAMLCLGASSLGMGGRLLEEKLPSCTSFQALRMKGRTQRNSSLEKKPASDSGGTLPTAGFTGSAAGPLIPPVKISRSAFP
mmetsp:Transcript_30780/g.89388  ORF Transcript_30780/g.89388 Transcript_30780/m.89388 type:complete len:242 (+) Transcript_30780:3550-4275(+)